MIRYLLLIGLFYIADLSAQSVTILSIQNEWTDENSVHSLFVAPHLVTDSDSITINVYSHDKLIVSASKYLSKSNSAFSLEFKRQNRDTITAYSVTTQSQTKNSVNVTDLKPFQSTDLKHSPLVSFRPYFGKILPSTEFLSSSDTITYDFMTEFYGVNKGDKLGFDFMIISSNKDTLQKSYSKIASADRLKHQINIPVRILKLGKYTTELWFYKNNSILNRAQSNNFYILTDSKSGNKTVDAGHAQSLYEGIFSSYSKEELDELFRKVYFLTSKEEKELFEKLPDVQSKRQFMSSFWQRRENISGQNFYDVFDRIAFVNSKYSIPGKPGYLTDKGRVFLTYGSCDDIYVSPSSSGTKPFEVWYYPSIESGVRFYFVDMNGFGEMRLIHSSAKNEISNLGSLLRLGIDPIEYRQ